MCIIRIKKIAQLILSVNVEAFFKHYSFFIFPRPFLRQNHKFSHWQPVSPCSYPESASTDQYHPILTQYHQVTTSAALYRPSTIKYQSVPPNTDPVPPSTNK